ncbi:two-component regulator propeller domain-containing protein [Massilia sp. Dwa41.01b]|uniref:two-component regulator propeller domain-containing protein n=2 Tax=unclassified Massilia TaxID=2609279 RepID=UPI001E513422|nr:two-component regulator propeller domain-containing protein [Massilia sp. Dwa41.01b]
MPSFRVVGAREGLDNPTVNAMLEDGAGHLWISTGAGISDFDPGSGRFRHYTARDGMAEGDYFVGSAYQSPDGSMYFGSFNSGLTMFHPATVRGDPHPPRWR